MRTTRSLLSLGAVAVCASLLTAQAPPRSALVTISGTVLDDAKTPLASAELGLALAGLAPASARSGDDGHFEFVRVPLTPGSITVRRLGYRAQTVTLDLKKIGAGEPLIFALDTVATEVRPVSIASSRGRLDVFYDHQAPPQFSPFLHPTDMHRS